MILKLIGGIVVAVLLVLGVFKAAERIDISTNPNTPKRKKK